MNEQDLSQLSDQIRLLKTALEQLQQSFNTHQHTGQDGSVRVDSTQDLSANSLVLRGSSFVGNSNNAITTVPLAIVDNVNASDSTSINKFRRIDGKIFEVLAKGNTNEEIVSEWFVAAEGDTSNATDFRPDKGSNFSGINLLHFPYYSSTDPNFSFFYGARSPFYTSPQSTGVISGTNLLTDPALNFVLDNDAIPLTYSYLNLFDGTTGVMVESHPILSNTKTTITINGKWVSTTNQKYSYQIFTPIFLGNTFNPWARGYFVGFQNASGSPAMWKAIRLGVGPSASGSPMAWIAYGNQSPEGFLSAQAGSLYLRTDGAAGTSLYVKESGTGSTGWVAMQSSSNGPTGEIFIPAEAMNPSSGSPCGALTHSQTSTNKVDYWGMDFGPSADTVAFFTLKMPDNWNGGSPTAQFVWTPVSGGSGQTVDWGIKGVFYQDLTTLDNSYGTEVVTTDTWAGSPEVYLSPESSGITAGGSPQAGCWGEFKITRKTGTDNMSGSARLLGVRIKYTRV